MLTIFEEDLIRLPKLKFRFREETNFCLCIKIRRFRKVKMTEPHIKNEGLNSFSQRVRDKFTASTSFCSVNPNAFAFVT